MKTGNVTDLGTDNIYGTDDDLTKHVDDFSQAEISKFRENLMNLDRASIDKMLQESMMNPDLKKLLQDLGLIPADNQAQNTPPQSGAQPSQGAQSPQSGEQGGGGGKGCGGKGGGDGSSCGDKKIDIDGDGKADLVMKKDGTLTDLEGKEVGKVDPSKFEDTNNDGLVSLKDGEGDEMELMQGLEDISAMGGNSPLDGLTQFGAQIPSFGASDMFEDFSFAA